MNKIFLENYKTKIEQKNTSMRHNIKKMNHGNHLKYCQQCGNLSINVYEHLKLEFCRKCLLERMKRFNVWKIINEIRSLSCMGTNRKQWSVLNEKFSK